MIRLTKSDSKPIYINPEKIITVESHHESGAWVEHGNDSVRVIESPEEVVRKVLEWQLSWNGD